MKDVKARLHPTPALQKAIDEFLPKGEAEAYCEKHDECIECCKDYWLAEVTDND